MRITFLFILLFFSLILTAQTVNIESFRMKMDTNKVFGNIDATFLFNKNSKTIWQAGLNSNIEYKNGNSTFMLISIYSFVNTKEDDKESSFVNEGFEHFRYMYKFHPKFKLETYLQSQFNKMMNLKHRELVGIGIRYKIFGSDAFNSHVGTSFMLENSEIYENPFETKHLLYPKSSNYLTMSAYFGRLRLSNTTYYQLNLENWKCRIYSVMESTINIYKKIYYKFGFAIQYDNDANYNAPSLIYSTNNRISIMF